MPVKYFDSFRPFRGGTFSGSCRDRVGTETVFSARRSSNDYGRLSYPGGVDLPLGVSRSPECHSSSPDGLAPTTIHERSPAPTCAVRSGLSGIDRRCHTIARGRGLVRSSGLPRGKSAVGFHAIRGGNPACTLSDQYGRSPSIQRVCRCLRYRSHSFSRLRRLSEGRVCKSNHSSRKSSQRPDSGVS